MEQQHEVEFEVKIISNETIKPSLPPTSHPETFNLSLLDQIFPAFTIPLLLFYNPNTPTPHKIDITSLKTSLSYSLDKFYPLAGRFLDDSTISCNNQGIPFIETKIDCHLLTLLSSPHKLKSLIKFLPPTELQAKWGQPISELIPLAFQINVFECGGVVLGCYMLHKFIDVASVGTFLKHWAALASKQHINSLVQPNFAATVKAFPPLPRVQLKHVFVPDLSKESSTGQSRCDSDSDSDSDSVIIIAKSFIFTSVALNKLKAKAASELVPTPTSFEALAAFVWEQAALASGKVKHTKLTFTVNMRQRMIPPLPKESIGNLLTNVHSQVDDFRSSNLQELVKEIHSELYKLNHRITTVYQGENGAEILMEEMKVETQRVMGCNGRGSGLYRLSSWCKLGLNEADFGFGKLLHIIPFDGSVPSINKNLIFFTDYSHPSNGDGIEAWLFLEEKEMQVLESNPRFLAFAAPS
ncbi:stemmadenine O-acetyltransferase [Beta vulgaris subsp. vulgaris]|uniref:stemmadenine O-acetyltransferase n=1 Tax=Beta vulgaris subsp. vulgaris TaxID=3555 RepID=UPI00203741F9|nr:stemmadenine O-acetyltransferase [Beta vulgaris subsp. vulgaris]